MKGLIFNEFLTMVEDKFGYEVVDQMIIDANIASQGAYTAVGTYPHAEMVSLVSSLSKNTKIPVPALLETYGEHALGIFAKNYERMFAGHTNAFSFLASVEHNIHVEVLKLYPEAELPSIISQEVTDKKIILTYHSSRKMADFAQGLIKGCLKHFNQKAHIEQKPLKDDLTEVEFTITTYYE